MQNLVVVTLLPTGLNFLTVELFTAKVFYILIKVILGELARSDHTHKQRALFENTLGYGVVCKSEPFSEFPS